jgi:hypothetical protein
MSVKYSSIFFVNVVERAALGPPLPWRHVSEIFVNILCQCC